MPMPSSVSSSTPPTSERGPLLDRALRAALVGLHLPVHRVRGVLPGMHPGSGPGPGEDFFQHRPYAEGEDVRSVDWRASARIGHLLVKERHRPLRQPLVLLLDASDSMGFPKSGPTKERCARQLAAALALLALRRRDPVTLQLLGSHGFAPAGRILPDGDPTGAVEAVLGRAPKGGRGDAGRALASLSPDRYAFSHLVLLSDLYGDASALVRGMERLVQAGAALSVLHVLADDDRSLPPGAGAVRDVETGEALSVPAHDALSLQARVEAWASALERDGAGAGAEWLGVDAGQPPGAALRRWLGGRP
jgi:uncharacterized protein (DUF58 family)